MMKRRVMLYFFPASSFMVAYMVFRTSDVLNERVVVSNSFNRYPNGEKRILNCKDPEYLCGMKPNGCNGYPQLFNMGELMQNWTPDAPDVPEHGYYDSLCRFNLSDPAEKQLAMEFRHKEVPFIVYDVPELQETSRKWTDAFLNTQLVEKPFKVEISDNNHFMYHHKSSENDPPPSYRQEKWTYDAFRRKVNANPMAGANQEHYYLFVSHRMYKKDQTATQFLRQDLSIFDPEIESKYENLFIRQPEELKSIHCRFGMRGIVAEGHFDAGVNMIAMVRGSKRYILSPPSSCACQYLFIDGPSARHTRVNWSKIDGKEFPLASQCQGTETVITKGDVLYVPSYWYHQIVSLDATIQCNARSGILSGLATDYLNKCGFY